MPDSAPKSPRFDPPGISAREAAGLPPGRWERGAWLFRDQTLHRIEILLDEAFRIPFTRIRFGIDGIIGMVPGLGDVLAGLLSLIIPVAAWMRGVPYITLLRMGVNLGIGVLVGSIPFLGDAFDIGWKANRRNYLAIPVLLVVCCSPCCFGINAQRPPGEPARLPRYNQKAASGRSAVW